MQALMLPHDKANHFLWGAIVAQAGNVPFDLLVGAAMCAAVAIGKEVYDRTSGKGTPDVKDALATLAGGAVALANEIAPHVL